MDEEEILRSRVMAPLNCKSEDFAQKYMAYKKAEAEFMAIYEPLKANLLDTYKDYPDLSKSVIIGGIKLTYVSPSVRTTVDTKKFKEEEPDLAKKYMKTTNVSATIKMN